MLSPENSAESGRWKTRRVPYMREVMDSFNDPRVKQLVVVAAAQISKALAVDTKIPTPDGWTTMGEIKVGDTVYDENGKPCKVTLVSGIMHDHRCFKVTFSDGSEIVADAGHKWYVESDTALEYIGEHPRRGIYEGVLTTEMISRNFKYGSRGNRNRYAIPVAKPIVGEEKDLPIEPYTLGAWLGDGHSYSSHVAEGTQDVDEIRGYIEADGYATLVKPDSENCDIISVETQEVIRDVMGVCRRGHKLIRL